MVAFPSSGQDFQYWCDRQLLELRSKFDQGWDEYFLPASEQSKVSVTAFLFEITEQHFQADCPGVLRFDAIDSKNWQILYQPATSDRLDVSQSQAVAEFFKTVSKCLSRQVVLMESFQVTQHRCQSLEVENEELTQISQLKSEFLANTSHEIRTPLSSILGFTHLLREQGFNPGSVRHQEYLRIILTCGQHLLALINDILDLSKIEANQLDLNLELVDLEPLCKLLFTLVQEKANDRGLQLVSEIPSDIAPLMCDPLRLKQMLFNLLSNALKFTTEGTVGLRIIQTEQVVQFIVWDTGAGISVDQLDRLFYPYQQLPQSSNLQAEGTGLGLALTRKLAELHRGRVEVNSVVEQGSQFTVVIPRSPNTLSRPEFLSSPLTIAETMPETIMNPPVTSVEPIAPKISPILLVEDNLNNAQLIMAYLQRQGFKVAWVKDHRELWKSLKKELPSLILMDIHLPDVNGLMLIQQLRADDRYVDIPIIAQTALAMSGDRQACMNAGATDYIAKPLDLQRLIRLLEKYLEREKREE